MTRLLRLAALLLAFLAGCSGKPPGYPYHVESLYSIDDPQFARTMGHLLGPPLEPGNSIQTLNNGDQIFPAMLQAIRAARHTITFETFIYWQGNIGQQFTDALCDRARSGVKVHLLVDAVGSTRIDKSYLKSMRDAGVEVQLYHALRWFDLSSAARLNNRTHRKLLVIDGQIGFTGGVGIADEWSGNAQDPDHWRDTHYRITGPAVAQLQAAFADNWVETNGHVLDGDAYFPKLEPAGQQFAQMFKSDSNGSGSESMQLMYLLSIAAARQHIRLGTAYFVPDHVTIEALQKARQRGVRVQVLVPGKFTDVPIARNASRAVWGDLLKSGVEIFEYQPTMYHTKMMVVDDRWVSIGSANLDNRSFRLNAEANLNVLDPPFAAEQAKVFDEDLRRARQITYEEWNNRPGGEKFKEWFASLFKWQL
jgi:cardiolipin synthase